MQTKVENNRISITKNIHIVDHGDFSFKFDVVRCVGCFRRKNCYHLKSSGCARV